MEEGKKEESAFEVVHLSDSAEVKTIIDAEHARFLDNAEQKKLETTKAIMGCPGAMISASKSGYRARFPSNHVIFNANIFTEAGKKIWYGDLDITISKQTLQDLSKELGEKIYVLYEWDGRFDFETNPRLDQAPWTCEPNGTIITKFS